ALWRAGSAAYVLEGDIHSCFTEIRHQWLLDHSVTDTTLLRQWLTAGCLEHGRLFPTERGTGQGGPLSPARANCTLDGLERLVARQFPAKGINNPHVHFARFADDFVIHRQRPVSSGD